MYGAKLVYILGQVKAKLEDSIILQLNNIAYRIHLNHTEEYKINNEYKFYTLVKPPILNSTLHSKFFGFATIQKKNLFEKLISINRNGPKTAPNILKLKYKDLIDNIKTNNINFFVLDNKISKRRSRRPRGLKKSTFIVNPLAHRTPWLRSYLFFLIFYYLVQKNLYCLS